MARYPSNQRRLLPPSRNACSPSRGRQGGAVRAIQHQLDTHANGVVVDNIFRSLTDRDVRAYQQQRGLRIDGIVGPQASPHERPLTPRAHS